MANIQVDVYTLRNAIKEAIDYVQGTNVIGIVFHFRDFDIPSGVSAKVYVKKPSGKAVYNTATINGNDINLKVTDQMFSETGITKLQVQITNGSSDLVSFVQPVIVHENNVAGDVPESKNESNFLDEYIQEMESATSAANNATKNANNAATAANNALESIEEAVQGTIINDNSPSSNTTYSGNKIDDMARVNLWSFEETTYIRCTGNISGNTITIKTSDNSNTQAAAVDYTELEKNKYYTIAWKSKRTGKYGGGAIIWAFTGSQATVIIDRQNELNGCITFKTPESFDKIRISLYSGNTKSEIGDTSTFTDIMLIEGTEYTPAMYNSRDIARLAATVDNRTAINLFDASSFAADINAKHETYGNGIKVTTTKTDSAYESTRKNLKGVLKNNTNYTICAKSTRTGEDGGGIVVYSVAQSDGKLTYLSNHGNDLNPIANFNSGNIDDFREITALFYSGNEVGDSATFTDIMLVEGDYAPGEYVPYIGADTFSDAIAGIKTTSTEMATNILQNATDISELQMDVKSLEEKVSDYKILWQGNYWPDDTQTCKLSEKVSDQKNGIILWFTVHNTGESSDNTGWFPYYVHKSIFEVKRKLGVSDNAGFCVPVVATGGFGTLATKYIYVHDTYVSGSASNKGEGTGKVEYNNRYWTLKAIVGW